MKSIKKIAIVFICVALALNLFLVGGPVKTDYDSNYLLPNGSYEDILSYWGNSLTASADAAENNKSTATPGEENTLYGTTPNSYPDTLIINKGSFKYYYEGSNYVYGIDKDNNEIIAYKHKNGQYFDMIDGAGKVWIKSYATLEAASKKVLKNETVNTFTEGTDNEGNKTLTVTYNLSGIDKATVAASHITVTYTFGYSAITVKYDIYAKSATKMSGAFSSIERSYINDGFRKEYGTKDENKNTAKRSKVIVNSQWVYPENLDFPYQEFEGLIYIDEFELGMRMYTSLRDGYESAKQHMVENKDGAALGCGFTDGTEITKNLEYTISFADATTEEQNPDYLGLFRGKKQEFATGVAPVDANGKTLITANSDHSTVFEGNSVDLNLNVTNITDDTIKFSLRYDIRDYYGNVVKNGLFKDNELISGLSANRTVTASGKYGIYYLNLYVISKGGDTYQECYPFALIPSHTYNNITNPNNPFGFASAAAGKNPDDMDTISDYTLSKYVDTANLMTKIGAATVRAGAEPGYLKMMKTLKDNGITKINGGTVETNFKKISKADITSQETVDAFKESIRNALRRMKDTTGFLIDSAEIGNEMSLYAMKDKNDAEDNGYVPIEQLYPLFYEYTHKPAYEVFKEEEFAGITYIPTQASACETQWLSNFIKEYNTGEIVDNKYIYTLVEPNKGDYQRNDDGTYTKLDRVGDVPQGSYTMEALNTDYPFLPTGSTVDSIWGDIEILTAHIYGVSGIMPDVYGAFNTAYGGDMWNVEAGVQRISKFLKDNQGTDSEPKDFYFTEVGVHTVPLSTNSTDLRTQADYIVRIGAIASAYGVDRIQYYQMYDRTSYDSGFNNSDAEYNWGLFYKQDYYGVIKPKPSGVAFAIMTQQLESMKKNGGVTAEDGTNICQKYDQGYNFGGVRAFCFDTAVYGNVVVAYSNQETLPNGKKNNDRNATSQRIPTLPWNSQWQETDPTEFETAHGGTVKVVDIMGNETTITDSDSDGKVTIELTGSPVYIHNVITQ